MSENMFCEGQKVLSPCGRDGYMRTFTGYPGVNDESWGLIQDLKEDPQKLFLFFLEYATDDDEYAAFLTRDVLNGIWTRE